MAFLNQNKKKNMHWEDDERMYLAYCTCCICFADASRLFVFAFTVPFLLFLPVSSSNMIIES
jgi:hypothetical protein